MTPFHLGRSSFPGGGLRGIPARRATPRPPRACAAAAVGVLREFKSEPFLVELYESRGLGGDAHERRLPAGRARLPALVFVCGRCALRASARGDFGRRAGWSRWA